MKKLLIFIVVFVVLAVVIFLAPAFLRPEVNNESMVLINKPTENVWQKFMNPENMGKWLSNFKRIEPISGAPETPGSKFKIVLDMEGQEQSAVETVNEVVPNTKFAFDLESDIFKDEITVTFENKGLSTEMVQTEKAYGKGLVWRAMMFWMSSTMANISQQNLENFKKFAEKSE
ncbi:MAG: SRPBCC family protein [Pyrinomonadaceae bacterium]